MRYLLNCVAISIIIASSCTNNGQNSKVDERLLQDRIAPLTEKITNDVNNAALYYKRGMALKHMQEDSLALADFQKAISLDSTKAEYYSVIGDLLFEHKDIEGSVKWFERALKLNPKDITAHLKMAKMFIYVKDYTSAFAEINTVLRQDVYNAQGYFLKGIIYKDIKDTLKSISSFQTAVNMSPNYKDAVIQLGLLYSAQTNPLALKYMDNAFKLDTMDVFPLYAKGVYYQNILKYEMAKSEYKSAIMNDRQYSNAYFNIGYILIQQDSFEKAWRQFDIVTKIEVNNAEAYYNRGLCSELLGKEQSAISDYKQALTFNDKHKQAQEGIKRLEK
jgi:tetratricopeptide (TPR) repeat protein